MGLFSTNPSTFAGGDFGGIDFSKLGGGGGGMPDMSAMGLEGMPDMSSSGMPDDDDDEDDDEGDDDMPALESDKKDTPKA